MQGEVNAAGSMPVGQHRLWVVLVTTDAGGSGKWSTDGW